MMAQRCAIGHPLAASGQVEAICTSARPTIGDGMSWLVFAVVVCAAVGLVLIVGRADPSAPRQVVSIDDDGLRARPHAAGAGTGTDDDPDPELVPWSSVHLVTVTVNRGVGRTRYRFDVRSETAGAVVVDGATHGEAFLAHTHRLPGFDHPTLERTLRSRGRAVCYGR